MPKARPVHKLEEKETGLNPDGYFHLKIPYQSLKWYNSAIIFFCSKQFKIFKMHNLVECSQRIRQKLLSANTIMYAICCYAAEVTQSSALALTLQPLFHRTASLSLLPQCNEHAMKWLWITDGASRDLSILIFSHSAGREMHWLQSPTSCSFSSSLTLLSTDK